MTSEALNTSLLGKVGCLYGERCTLVWVALHSHVQGGIVHSHNGKEEKEKN